MRDDRDPALGRRLPDGSRRDRRGPARGHVLRPGAAPGRLPAPPTDGARGRRGFRPALAWLRPPAGPGARARRSRGGGGGGPERDRPAAHRPVGPHLTGSGLLFGVGLAIAILVCAAIMASTITIWRLDRPIPVIGGDRVRIMVPVRRSERVWFLALSVAAGVCEELLFRGLLPALLSALLHGPPAWFVILLAAIAFGAAHAYQGTAGVAATAVLGALMGIIYLATGSLFVVMVLHALIDARVGLLPARAVGGRRATRLPPDRRRGGRGSREVMRCGFSTAPEIPGRGRPAAGVERLDPGRSGPDRRLRPRHERPPVDPRGPGAGPLRTFRRHHRPRAADAFAGPGHEWRDLPGRRRPAPDQLRLQPDPLPGTGARRLAGSGQTTTLVSVEEVPGGLQAVLSTTVEIEGASKPACVAEGVVRLMA